MKNLLFVVWIVALIGCSGTEEEKGKKHQQTLNTDPNLLFNQVQNHEKSSGYGPFGLGFSVMRNLKIILEGEIIGFNGNALFDGGFKSLDLDTNTGKKLTVKLNPDSRPQRIKLGLNLKFNCYGGVVIYYGDDNLSIKESILEDCYIVGFDSNKDINLNQSILK